MTKKKAQSQTRFVDIPELSETFSDSINSFSFDGQAMKIDFCVSRMDTPKPPSPPSYRQYPSCRLVLTPNAALDLFNKLQQLVSALEQSGAVKRETIIPDGGSKVSH